MNCSFGDHCVYPFPLPCLPLPLSGSPPLTIILPRIIESFPKMCILSTFRDIVVVLLYYVYAFFRTEMCYVSIRSFAGFFDQTDYVLGIPVLIILAKLISIIALILRAFDDYTMWKRYSSYFSPVLFTLHRSDHSKQFWLYTARWLLASLGHYHIAIGWDLVLFIREKYGVKVVDKLSIIQSEWYTERMVGRMMESKNEKITKKNRKIKSLYSRLWKEKKLGREQKEEIAHLEDRNTMMRRFYTEIHDELDLVREKLAEKREEIPSVFPTEKNGVCLPGWVPVGESPSKKDNIVTSDRCIPRDVFNALLNQ